MLYVVLIGATRIALDAQMGVYTLGMSLVLIAGTLRVLKWTDPQLDHKMEAVERILSTIKAKAADPRASGTGYRRADGKGAPRDKSAADIPRLVVFNKIDLLDKLEAKGLANRHKGIAVSATQGIGIDELVEQCAEILSPTPKKIEFDTRGETPPSLEDCGAGDPE